MNSTANARRLRREQTQEEKELWRALRAGRFAGFKFRRQHPAVKYVLDFYCPVARLSVELDGFQHTTVRVLEERIPVWPNVDLALLGERGCERFEIFMPFSPSRLFAKLPGCTLEKSFSPNSPT